MRSFDWDDWIKSILVHKRQIYPTVIENLGDWIDHLRQDGFVGGQLTHLESDGELLRVINKNIGKFATCGHLVRSIDEVGGICHYCGGVACIKEGCYAIDTISGIAVCRNCYRLEDGVVVSEFTRRTRPILWRLDVMRVKHAERKRIEETQRCLPKRDC